jgi:hypothetical protein
VFRYSGGRVAGGISNITLRAGQTLGDQDLPLDPSGVIYDSQTHRPVAGVRVTLTDAAGRALPATCLIDASQQNQVTADDGAYRFDIVPGAHPRCLAGETEYRIQITNPAGYRSGVSTIIPPQTGAIDLGTCPGDAIPGGPCQMSASDQPPATGAGVYYIAFLAALGDPNLIHNHIAIDPLGAGGENLTKVAKVSTIHRGERVPYVIRATEIQGAAADIADLMPAGFVYVKGSARANGAVVTPVITGRQLFFDNLVPENGEIVLDLILQATAAAGPGTYVNIAQLLDDNGGVIATARASVDLIPDHVFDCGEIIGKVFDDRNHDGYQDEGEPGLPGVRVATVRGLLVITDKHGRFHVACADLPDEDIGSNFIMKLDERALPTGYKVTTENPRTVRLTRGKVTKLNFGAAATRIVSLDLADKVFVPGTTRLNTKWVNGLPKLFAVLEQQNSTLRLVYRTGADGKAIAQKRAEALRKLIASRWREQAGRYELPIEVRIVGNE